ncbi:dienelactone hydrolase family protein [Haliscomenobacter hydrossis]|uniref:Dienelactone hydrolase n=1 Tax=Haliscomenobacter hydrossis (strain ATCC 27775 / DSM 1100 / LMG 10767 / O) TaxID=760192 RepID=F4KW71_HALH1|nr:dienelactone hydrolase family protein [Haliscomenobacter hydrossis]AEE49259.1 dienelactone hydrolase [Haliscomenobacter hydrossis DSM 1100]
MNYFLISSLSIVLSLLTVFQPIRYNTPAVNPVDAPMPMCHNDNEGMAAFVDDPKFVALHPSPLPLDYAEMGSSVNFKTPDGQTANGYMIKAKKKSKKWLFVYQEWWGLNDYIKKQSDIFYTDLGGAVNVIALDMYDGKVTSDPKEAGGFMRGVQETRLESIVKGAMMMAGKKAKIANVGWCFGGGWSLKSAILGGKQTVGSVMYYGMPVQDVEKLKTLNSDVLGLFATEEYISKKVIEDFAANMKTAGKSLNYKIFGGVHGFANPSNPKHDPAMSKEAYDIAIGYLKQKFGV